MKKLIAKEGFVYTPDMQVFSKVVFLGVNDKEGNYHLVTEEEANKIIEEQQKAEEDEGDSKENI